MRTPSLRASSLFSCKNLPICHPVSGVHVLDDLILLDTRPAHVRAEGVYVINLEGALLVKRLCMRLSGQVDVVSDNEHYSTETISGEQLASLQILGRVVWQGRRI